MKLHVVYRSSESQGKNRPGFFSKRLALLSFLRTLRACPGQVEVCFVNDGPIPEDRRELMHSHGEVLELPGLGNSASHRQAIALVERRQLDDDDLAYFLEDDYVHLEDALTELLAAAQGIPEAAYLTTYNVLPIDSDTGDRGAGRPRRYRVGNRQWRTVAATTMTFAARPEALWGDAWLHFLGTQKQHPHDLGIWLGTQGLRPYRTTRAVGAVDIVPRDGLVARHLVKGAIGGGRDGASLLVCADPALATHAEEGVLAPGVDWEAEARDIQSWAERQGLTPRQ